MTTYTIQLDYDPTPTGDQGYDILCDGSTVHWCRTREEALAWVRAQFEPLPWVEWLYAEHCALSAAVLRDLPEPRALRRLVPMYAERLLEGEPITGAEAWEITDQLQHQALRDGDAAWVLDAIHASFPTEANAGARYRAYVAELHQAYLEATVDCAVTRRGLT